MYQELRKTINPMHPIARSLYDIHIGKLAKHMDCSRVHLAGVLSGNRDPGRKFERKLKMIANQIETERKQEQEGVNNG